MFDSAGQHERLGNEARLDEPLSSGDWERRKYPERGITNDHDLARWSLMEWDRLTDEKGNAQYLKANRPPKPISLETVIGYDRFGRAITAEDQFATEQYERDEREAEAGPRIELLKWFWFWSSLSEPEQETIRLLAGEMPNGDYLPRGRSGREVARMLGVTENMIRKRREAAARKLSEAGVTYRTRSAKPNHGPEWCARRPAPSLGCASHTVLREAVTGVQTSLGRLSPAA